MTPIKPTPAPPLRSLNRADNPVTVGAPANGSAPRPAIRAEDSGTVARLAAAPPMDSARVDAIREALDAGTYPLKPALMADALIAARYLLKESA